MVPDDPIIEVAQNKSLGIMLYNKVWEYLDKPSRTPLEGEMMLHCAHASCWHWLQAGTELNHARGAWILSRAYAVLGHGSVAHLFAERCLSLCEENGIGDFDLAYAHEAMARAYSLLGDSSGFEKHLAAAKEAAAAISKEEDRSLFQADLSTVPGFH